MIVTKLVFVLVLKTFCSNYLFDVYGIKHSDYMALYPGHPYSLHRMDYYP